MKRIVCLIIINCFLLQSLLLATDNNTIKYKWSQLDLVTKFKSGVVATWSEYKGYSLLGGGPAFGGMKIKPEDTREIEGWYVTKGGGKISEIDFLKTINDEELVNRAENDANVGNWINYISIGTFFGGIICLAIYSRDAIAQESQKTLFGAFILLSAAANYLNPYNITENTHHISYNDAGYKIDLYNRTLREELKIKEELTK